ncbi:T9SS type A sorting domain-containing protein [Halpernia sp. GG3]
MYPNPTSDFFNFSEKIENLLIFDNAGRIIKSVKNSTEIIDISKLSKGIYTISGFVNGKKVTRKIIKK